VTIIEQGSGPAPQAPSDLIKETTTQTFVKDVIEESKRQPVLIDFWAEWCGPCRQLTPILEKAVRAAGGKVKLVKMNIDHHPAIPGQMGIQSIPAVIAFVNGQPADGFMGAVPESQVTGFINKLTAGMPNPGQPNIAEILQEADAVLAEGDPAGAAQIYAEVLAVDATNIPALAGLAKCYVATGAVEQAKQTLAMVPESKRNDAAVLPSRPMRLVRWPSSNRKSPQTRSIIRRYSIWRRRSTPVESALKQPSSCSKSSSVTANGTRTAPASSWCSSSKPGARPMRPPLRDESGCRPSFFPRDLLRQQRNRKCRSMPNIADPASFPR
jgi:thioredoxin